MGVTPGLVGAMSIASGGNESIRTVLCVDDVEINREIVAAALDSEFDVVGAANGLEALDVMRSRGDIAAVLLDLAMPIMDGKAFLREVSRDPVLSRVPVLVMTSDDSSEVECLDLGAVDFITKPINAKITKRRITSAIRLREMGQALAAVSADAETGLLTRNAFVYEADVARKEHVGKPLVLSVGAIRNFVGLRTRLDVLEQRDLLSLIAASIRKVQGVLVTGYLDEGFFAILVEGRDASALAKDCRAISEMAAMSSSNKAVVDFGIVDNIAEVKAVSDALSYGAEAIARLDQEGPASVGFHDEAAQKRVERQRLLAESARESLINNEIFLVYQPVHSAKTDALVGCEALIRWRHPELGLVMPEEFMPFFEDPSLAHAVNEFAFNRVCSDLADWKSVGVQVVPVSVKLLGTEVMYDGLADRVLHREESAEGIPNEFIRFVIAEDMCAYDAEEAAKSIGKLKTCGYGIEFQDKEVSQFSMSLVASLPIDSVRVDASAVQDDLLLKEFVLGVVEFAHSVSKRVVAERVGTGQIAHELTLLGVDMIQGYCKSHPLAPSEFAAYLRDAYKKQEDQDLNQRLNALSSRFSLS